MELGSSLLTLVSDWENQEGQIIPTILPH